LQDSVESSTGHRGGREDVNEGHRLVFQVEQKVFQHASSGSSTTIEEVEQLFQCGRRSRVCRSDTNSFDRLRDRSSDEGAQEDIPPRLSLGGDEAFVGVCPIHVASLSSATAYHSRHPCLQARFKVQPLMIKKRINSLMEREYLQRDVKNKAVYEYLA